MPNPDGRPKGSRNKRTLAFDEQVAKWFKENPTWRHPVQVLLDMAEDPKLDPDLRQRAAKDAAPYLAPRKRHVEVDEKSDRTINIRDMRKPTTSDDAPKPKANGKSNGSHIPVFDPLG